MDCTKIAKKENKLSTHDDLVKDVLGKRDGLHFRFLRNGRLHSVRYGEDFLANLILGCPLAGSLQRLDVEIITGQSRQVIPVIGSGSEARFHISEEAAFWQITSGNIEVKSRLSLVADNGWKIDVQVTNNGDDSIQWRAFHGLDVGLSNVGAIRTNEDYILIIAY